MYAAHTLRDRVLSAILTVALTLLIGWALIAGLAMGRERTGGESLATFDVAVPPPPPRERVVPRRLRRPRPEGRAAPPNLRSQATQIVAPPPPIVVQPPPIIVAPVAGLGSDATQGAADRPGPGTGAGGIGDGTGSGGEGDGDGGPGEETPPRWLRGRLSFADGAKVAGESVIGRKISTRCTLEVNGRVTACVVSRSSGIPVLDETICRLVEKRFRYTPWLDTRGRPVRSVVLVDHEWIEEG